MASKWVDTDYTEPYQDYKNDPSAKLSGKQEATRRFDESYAMANVGLPKNFSSNFMERHRPSGYKEYVHQNFTPAQMQLYNQLFGLVDPEGKTSRLAMGDQGEFEAMERPALQQFGQLQGNIASKFSGQGMGSRKSSGFQNTQSAAAQDFAGQLQANRQNLQRQAIMDMMGLSGSLFKMNPYTSGYAQKGEKGGPLQGWGQGGGALVGAAADAYTGQPGTFTSAFSKFGGMFD